MWWCVGRRWGCCGVDVDWDGDERVSSFLVMHIVL